MDDKKRKTTTSILIGILSLGVIIGLMMAIVASGLSLGMKIALICIQYNDGSKPKLSATIGDEK